MLGGGSSSGKFAYTTNMITLDQNPPVLNTLHEVLNATGGVRILSIIVLQTNTPTNNEEIDVVVTVDGSAYTFDGSAIGTMAHNTAYGIYFDARDPVAQATMALSIDFNDITGVGYHNMLQIYEASAYTQYLCGRTIKIEVRQTSAIAAGARIRCKVVYELLRGL